MTKSKQFWAIIFFFAQVVALFYSVKLTLWLSNQASDACNFGAFLLFILIVWAIYLRGKAYLFGGSKPEEKEEAPEQ
jgi:hypothetical protein